MSTGGHGETTRPLDHLRLLRERLDRILSTVRTKPHFPSDFTRSIHDAHQFFGKWYQENIGREGDRIYFRNEEKASRIDRIVEEAHRLASHCEFRLELEQRGSRDRVGRDDYERDCASHLEHTIRGLHFPDLGDFIHVIPTMPAQASPATNSRSSASPAISNSNRTSPAAQESNGVRIKQESDMNESPSDTSHYRKDSHWSQQNSPEYHHRMSGSLPSFGLFTSPSPLAEVPDPTPWRDKISLPPIAPSSPSLSSVASPGPSHHTPQYGSNDHIVMMSPGPVHPTPVGLGPPNYTNYFTEHRNGRAESTTPSA